MKKFIGILVLGLLVCNIASTDSSLPECKGDDHRQWTDCQGTYTYMTEGEDKYIGEWKDGWEHGQGTFTLADGSKYVGEWKNGKKHGQGTYTWALGKSAGDKYVGEWKDGWEHGQGTYTWADGRKYVGRFKNGLMHGYGTAINFDGRTVKGIFKDGKLFKQQ